MNLPEPMTTPDCDLRGLPFMPLDVVRLGDSDLAALSTGDEFKAAVLLWCKAWLQVPAASLPDDDRVLAHLTGLGPKWKKVREMALKGWVKCSDGRLYHPVIAEKAREAWKHRQSQRERVAKRWADRDPSSETPSGAPTPSRSGKRSERMAEARKKGTHTAHEWTAMLVICDHRCVRCGADGRLEKDHILPVYAGGSDAIDNLQPLCPRCNCAKGPDQRDLRPGNWKERLPSATPSELPTKMPTVEGTGRLQGRGTGTVEGKHQAQPSSKITNLEPSREKPPLGITDPGSAFEYVCRESEWRPANDSQRQSALDVIRGWLAFAPLELILAGIASARSRKPNEPTKSLKRFDSTIRGMASDRGVEPRPDATALIERTAAGMRAN